MGKTSIKASFNVTHRFHKSLSAHIYYLLSIDSRARFIGEFVAPCQVMVDMGCGGGWMLLRKKAQYLIGVDVSFPALKKAKRVYDEVILADVRFLPLRSNCLDALISMDVLGHIPNDYKDWVLDEMGRVLKGSGYTYHLAETDGSGIIPRLLEKSPSIYAKYMVDLDGHVGLEPPEQFVKRFKMKFVVVKVLKIYSGFLWPISSYLRRLDNECKELSTVIKFFVGLAKLSTKTPLLHALTDCVLGILSKFYDLITPFNYADGVYVVAKKGSP